MIIETLVATVESVAETAAEVSQTLSELGKDTEIPHNIDTQINTSNYELSEDLLSSKLENFNSQQPIKPELELNDNLISEELKNKQKTESFGRCPPENCSYGEWEGERGNSNFIPSESYIPSEKIGKTNANPDGLSMKELFEKNGIDKLKFENGHPDFSSISKGNAEIDNFTTDRPDNFKQAYEKLSEQRGCTQRDVKNWMKENNYTFHECPDCKTLQKVPNEIHANIRHDGGVHIAKTGGM